MPGTGHNRLVHLVRHGEVWNPRHLVYSDLPGFGLSAFGHTQAQLAARHLAGREIRSVVASPLQRAIETAIPIAAVHDVKVTLDVGLVEWGLSKRWAGHCWDDLAETFPGEVAAYLQDPRAIPFSIESLDALADRIAATMERTVSATPQGDVVFVSHQDPIHAGRRRLTGKGFAAFHADKPAHAAVISLDPSTQPWTEDAMWTPQQETRATSPAN